MSATFLNNFRVLHINDKIYDIVSLHNENIIISCLGSSEFYIYHVNGSFLSRITVSGVLSDVTWTADGKHIAYITRDSCMAVLITSAGDVMTRTQMKNPRCLSLSADGIVYLADGEMGVYRLTKKHKWIFVFKPSENWHCLQVIKVSSIAHTAVFWTLERLQATDVCQLRMYSTERDRQEIKWRNIDCHMMRSIYVNLLGCKLAYDGDNYVLMTDCCANSVHLFTLDGNCHREILTFYNGLRQPFGLAVDHQRKLLFVGQWNAINMFKIHNISEMTQHNSLLSDKTLS